MREGKASPNSGSLKQRAHPGPTGPTHAQRWIDGRIRRAHLYHQTNFTIQLQILVPTTPQIATIKKSVMARRTPRPSLPNHRVAHPAARTIEVLHSSLELVIQICLLTTGELKIAAAICM
jgi:hypothetical protein